MMIKMLEGINFSLKKHNWKNFEKNNVIVALNVVYAKQEIISPVSYLCFKTNLNR